MSEKEIQKLIDDKLKTKQFGDEVRKIVADVIVELFKVLWQKKANWYNDVKK